MFSDFPSEIQSTETIESSSAISTEKTCQVRPRIMTHSCKPIQRIRILGVDGIRGRRLPPVCRTATSSCQRSSPNPCGLFSGPKLETVVPKPMDLDDEAIMDLFKPPLEHQLSVLSTDSGILPRDIRDSSFVDDVIGELTSHGICHSDIITEVTVPAAMSEAMVVPSLLSKTCGQLGPVKRKAQSPLDLAPPLPLLSPDSINADDNCSSLTGYCTSSGDQIKRIKNNEASRKSRATRKWKNAFKEHEIASLEEENLRLNLLLKDFSEVATTCKRWLVQKMEHPET